MLALRREMIGKSSIEEGMLKGDSIVQVQPNGCQKGQTKENKEGDIVAYLLPRAKGRLISKHKQIKTSNTQSWFYSNHHTDSTAHRGVYDSSYPRGSRTK